MNDIGNNLIKLNDKTKPQINFIFEDGFVVTKEVDSLIIGLNHNGYRPIAIEWSNDSKSYIPTKEDMEWIYHQMRFVMHPSVAFKSSIRKLLKEENTE
jgi:hypothetical protein